MLARRYALDPEVLVDDFATDMRLWMTRFTGLSVSDRREPGVRLQDTGRFQTRCEEMAGERWGTSAPVSGEPDCDAGRRSDPRKGALYLGILVPWPENDRKRCHGVLEVDGEVAALGANGRDEVVSGEGLGRKTRWVASTFLLPFTVDDEANPEIRIVGRRAETGEMRSLPACPSTSGFRRAELNAVDWRIHLRAYPDTGPGSAIPNCIRSQLAGLGAPIDGRLEDGAPAGRTVSPLSWRGRKVIEACRRWNLRRMDFACTLRNSATRCEDQWRRTEGDTEALDLAGMMDHLLSGKDSSVTWKIDENAAMRAARKAREEERASALRREAERWEAELQARKRWEASPEGRAAAAAKAERERQAAAQHARDFPFYVLIRCGDLGHINIAVCLDDGVETTLRLRNGSSETLYNLTRIIGAPPGRETRDGYRIDLRSSYGLIIQNASSQIMGVRVYERRTGRQVFAREVSRYGTIATAR